MAALSLIHLPIHYIQLILSLADSWFCRANPFLNERISRCRQSFKIIAESLFLED